MVTQILGVSKPFDLWLAYFLSVTMVHSSVSKWWRQYRCQDHLPQELRVKMWAPLRDCMPAFELLRGLTVLASLVDTRPFDRVVLELLGELLASPPARVIIA
jgi:hypothetical protein